MRRFKKNNNLAKVFYSVFGSLPLLVTLYLYPLIPENIPVPSYPEDPAAHPS